MVRKLALTLLAFALAGGLVLAAGVAAEPATGVHAVMAESPCPVTGCASVECHAWDSLTTRYHQASDASLNLWLLAPVALVVGLVLIVRKVG